MRVPRPSSPRNLNSNARDNSFTPRESAPASHRQGTWRFRYGGRILILPCESCRSFTCETIAFLDFSRRRRLESWRDSVSKPKVAPCCGATLGGPSVSIQPRSGLRIFRRCPPPQPEAWAVSCQRRLRQNFSIANHGRALQLFARRLVPQGRLKVARSF